MCQHPGYFIYNYSSQQRICMSKKCPDYAPYVEQSGECTVFCSSGYFEVEENSKDPEAQSMFCRTKSCSYYYVLTKDSLKRCVTDCSSFQMIVYDNARCGYKDC